jgi:hypothetical protein
VSIRTIAFGKIKKSTDLPESLFLSSMIVQKIAAATTRDNERYVGSI